MNSILYGAALQETDGAADSEFCRYYFNIVFND